MQSRFTPLIELASILSTAVVLWFGARRVLDGQLTLGLLLVFLTYLGALYKPVKSLSKLSQIVSKGLAAAERVLEVMDAPIDIEDRPNARAVPLCGRIELRDVTFSYDPERPLIESLSLTVEPG